MPLEELGTAVTDTVTAALVEVEPPQAPTIAALPSADVDLVVQARTIADATIERTGSGPPPDAV